MKESLIAALVAGVLFVPSSLRAATPGDQDQGMTTTKPATELMDLFGPSAIVPPVPGQLVTQPLPRLMIAESYARPVVLAPMYVSLAALQVYDGYTTTHGVKNGAQEANELVGGLASKPVAFWAVKVGTTALSIFVAERLWRNHNRGAAIATMVISNGLMGVIAARNANVLRATR
jgi:Domain of unknown function (DUF5658)